MIPRRLAVGGTGFNSTTVQLIRRLYIRNLQGSMFQFHNGTINTLPYDREANIPDVFQFHNGTINTVRKGKTGWSEQVSIPQRYN